MKTASKTIEIRKINNSCAKAMYDCTVDLLDMGDSIIDTMEGLQFTLERHTLHIPETEDEYNACKIMFRTLAAELPVETFETIKCLMLEEDGWYLERLCKNLAYEDENNIKHTMFYRSLKAMQTYLKHYKRTIFKSIDRSKYDKVMETIEEWLEHKLPSYDMRTIAMARHISTTYWHYLDDMFGTRTNSCMTVGHIPVSSEEKRHFWRIAVHNKQGCYPLQYTMAQNIYNTGITLEGLFTIHPSEKTRCFEIFISKPRYVNKTETCIGDRDIMPENDNRFIIRFPDNVDLEKLSIEVARLFNQVGAFMLKRCEYDEDLKHITGYEEDVQPYMQIV